MKKPTIREAEASDKREIAGMRLLMQEHMEASNPGIWRMTDEGKRRIAPDVEETLTDEDGQTLVAEEEGTVIGFAHGHVERRETYTPRTIGYIHTIYVRETHRRRGTGTRLVRELCRFFRSRGVEEVNLGYVLGNKEGEMFWGALGFEPVIQTANTPLKALEERLGK